MACTPKNISQDRLISEALHEEFFADIKQDTSPLDKAKALIRLGQEFESAEVKAANLSKKTIKMLQLEADEIVRSYQKKTPIKSKDGEMVTPVLGETITMKNQEAFLRSKNKRRDLVDAIRNAPDSVLAAMTGTIIHNIAEGIIEGLKARGTFKNIHTQSELGQVKDSITDMEIKSLLNISGKYSDRIVQNIREGIEDIVRDVNALQHKIDPKGKAIILTEQFIANFLGDVGGTMDMFVMYSDGSVGLFDFKSKFIDSRDFSWRDVVDTATGEVYKAPQITNELWIPSYLRENLGRQLGSTRKIIQKVLKVQKFRQMRGIPIHVRYKVKDSGAEQGAKYSKELLSVQIGSKQDRMLEQIPINETLSSPALDRAVEKFQKLLHNKKVELQERGTKVEKDKLRTEIANLEETLSNLIVRQDARALMDDFENLIKKYNNEVKESLDIDSKEIGGNPNPNYLPWKRLNALIDDFTAYKSLLESSETWLADMDTTNIKVEEYMSTINNLTGHVNSLLTNLKSKRFNRTVSESDMPAIMNMEKISFMDKWFLGSKEFNQWVLKTLNQYVSTADSKRILKVQELESSLQKSILNLQEWGRTNNKGLHQAYRMLISDEGDGTFLIGKYNSEFWKNIEMLREKKNLEGLKKIYKLREGAEQLYKDRLEDFMKTNPTELQIENWKRFNTIENSIKYRSNAHIYWEFKDEVKTNPANLSPQFAEISKPGNEALLDFYNLWTDKMKEFRKLLEITDYTDLPDNFLPWIRAQVSDLIATGNLSTKQAKELIDSWKDIKVDNTEFGDDPTSELTRQVDLETGREKSRVPQFFLNPLKDNRGRLLAKAQLKDLASSLLTFGNMAYNYHYMTSEVVPHVEALRDALTMYGEKYTTSDGRQKVDEAGRELNIQDKLSSVTQMFEDQLKYHVYGMKILDENKKLANFALNMKQFHSNYQLAGAWLTWAGNTIQIFGNTYLESTTSQHFGLKHYRKAMAMAAKSIVNYKTGEGALYAQLVRFFEPNSDLIRLKSKQIKATKFQSILDSDTNFIGFRIAEHGVENITLISMLQTHGIVNGRIVNLNSSVVPKGTKSILESSRLNENGELIIEGLKETESNDNINIQAYTDMRVRSRGVSKNIKGGMDSENQYGAQMYLAGKMFMQYKGWLPGMVTQRLGGLMYNSATKSLRQGWFRTFYDMNLKPEEAGLVTYIATQLIPTMNKLTLALVTRPLSIIDKRLVYRFKADETRAKRQFEAFKDKNANDPEIQNMTFEDFVAFQEGRIRAMVTEVLFALSFVLAVMAARRDWDDDGVPDWKASWYSRTSFRILNRARRELNFMWAINDWQYTLTRSPIPAVGVIEDAARVLNNTVREAGDFVWSREEAEKRGKGVMKYTPRMFPWYKFLRSFDTINEEFQKFEI